MRTVCVPFTLADLFHGLGEANGIISADEEALHLEFTMKDALLGVVKSGIRDVTVPMADLATVRLKRSVFRVSLEITTRSLKALESVPGAQGNHIELRLARKDRALAEEFMTGLRCNIADYTRTTGGDAPQATRDDQ